MRMLGITFLVWMAEAITLVLTGHAIGFDLTPFEGLYLVGVGGIFLLIPSGPGYAGTFDAAILFGSAAAGASSEQAVSFLLAARFVDFVPITLVGLVLVLTRYGWRSGSSLPVVAPGVNLTEFDHNARRTTGDPAEDDVEDREEAEQEEAPRR